jgi:hypothetical protein
MTERATQIAQFLGLVAAATFVGSRFVPAPYRQTVGVTLTVCYLIGLAAFIVYVVFR